MSDIKFACIHCGQKLSCDPALTGQRITCPACQRSLLVPWAHTAAHPVATNPANTSAAAHNPPDAPPPELPTVSIPQLSPPDPSEALPVRPLPKVLQLEGRRRRAPGFSKLAVATFGLSLLGPFGFIPAIACGHIAKWRMRRNPALRGETLATAGLAIAYTCAVFTAVFVARRLLREL